MRVVAGELRGRRFATPSGKATRPTTDKVREALFNALGSLDVLVGAQFADLYAGSGAVGIEALSRGARECTFVEFDRDALQVLRTNVEALGLTERSRIVTGDVLAVASALDAELVYADPPYGFAEWERLLGAVRAPFVVAESGSQLSAPPGWVTTRSKRYGRTWVTFFER